MDMVIETMKDGRGKEYLNALHLLVKVLKLFIIKSINSFFFHLTLFPINIFAVSCKMPSLAGAVNRTKHFQLLFYNCSSSRDLSTLTY